ncbi:hypothetical protein [Chryseobacterium sp. WX]|uniref:hypothetical protein n=1 Tax=Chryseobacterium sp. WX TaxID=3031803 RepID=UPI002409AA61|nr:hypothetical protein [Chryseobacterium sp. WX]WFB67068.1 hypothetical protein PZ898_20490 [Chryseobacterium sp. WX]
MTFEFTKEQKEFFKDESDKSKYIHDWIDKNIVKFPSYKPFYPFDIVRDEFPKHEQRAKVNTIFSEALDIMVDYGYIERNYNTMYVVMKELGIQVKEAGGYYKYLESKKEKIDWYKIIPIILTSISVISVITFGLLNQKKTKRTEELEVNNKILIKRIDSLVKVNKTAP